MESDTGEPITTEHGISLGPLSSGCFAYSAYIVLASVRYGLQVTICVLASATELRTAKALQVIGPGTRQQLSPAIYPIQLKWP